VPSGDRGHEVRAGDLDHFSPDRRLLAYAVNGEPLPTQHSYPVPWASSAHATTAIVCRRGSRVNASAARKAPMPSENAPMNSHA
jgi:DMSO/TMAO reductase YedYZ molybdopterin-dependent catalytic subunit